MPRDYLHNHAQFADLIRIVGSEKSIDPALVEKDYWIMHCLFGLQALGLTFELKGGTSLSKGFQVIDWFSEDIDIRIEPPPGRDVKMEHNQTKPAHMKSREDFYDWLAETIRINGITEVARDRAFDNPTFFSGGIRLFYKSFTESIEGLKPGILLEAGFDVVAPNTPKDISSWAYDHAVDKVEILDNRAKAVALLQPRIHVGRKASDHLDKIQETATSSEFPVNFMRHYYDVFSLLQRPEVQAFVGTEDYQKHKAKRFRTGDNPNITENPAFVLRDPAKRALYEMAYASTTSLYYKAKPTFGQILEEIGRWAERL